ncbi:MAG: hypothetical protein CME64_14685 [Halobacteriovoraceae bacterium]|nr:hypothetical protein [Halobacteriovoraceae bacterium]MBJ00702.1 hypothetical protein [Halobacteriovoraceae bacterium]|tara:strand:+ start:4483 stop:5166 length:684 start_codon:yes stop_codon:yes gene_type:complete
MSYENNYKLLKLAAELLGNLKEDLVFVGGSTTCLYVDPVIGDELRPTEDVDCVVRAYSIKEYYKVEKRLRKLGFINDTRKDAPICRFLYGELLTLDVMPDDQEILGFSNSWYKAGIQNRIKVDLGGHEISAFSLPYFLASKFEAFESRGISDPRLSSDLEDIIMVLDGVKDLKIKDLNSDASKFLSEKASDCLNNNLIQEAINGFLSTGNNITRVNRRLESLVSLGL